MRSMNSLKPNSLKWVFLLPDVLRDLVVSLFGVVMEADWVQLIGMISRVPRTKDVSHTMPIPGTPSPSPSFVLPVAPTNSDGFLQSAVNQDDVTWTRPPGPDCDASSSPNAVFLESWTELTPGPVSEGMQIWQHDGTRPAGVPLN